VYPHSAAGRDAEEAYARSPSSDHAQALTTMSACSIAAPSGAPMRFSVHISRIAQYSSQYSTAYQT
jgi:hypothetical protein